MSALNMAHGGRFHIDDRATRYCDIFPEIEKGDINISIIEPGAAALCHRHKYQDDYQMVIKGALKVGVCNAPYMNGDDMDKYGLSEEEAKEVYEKREELLNNWKTLRDQGKDDQPLLESWPAESGQVGWHYLSEKNAINGPLFIPRYLWHGCYNYTNEQAILVYHITNKYDGDDEDRMDPFIGGWPYERIVK